MAWQFVVDGRGQEWAVDPDLMYALVRANYRAVELRRRMRVEVESHMIGPNLTNVIIDYDGLRAAVDSGAHDWWMETRNRLSVLPGEQVVQDLTLLRAEERAKTSEVQQAQRAAQQATSGAISASVNRGEVGLGVATFVRDLSAATLVVGATIVSGGAAAAAASGTVSAFGGTFAAGNAAAGVLAAGSGLKGIAKYQDTGNVGSAIIEGSGQFVLGAIGIAGEGASALGGNVLVVLSSSIDAITEGGKAIIEGQKASDAAKLAAARFGVALIANKLPFAKFGGWEKIRAVVSGAVSVAGDKVVGLAGPRLPDPPAANKVSWLPAKADDDRFYVTQQVLRPIASMPGYRPFRAG